MDRVFRWVAGFGRFWYGFVVGDDWTIAAAVVVGLAVTALVRATGATAWWLLPLLVIATLGVSLRRSRAQ